MNLYANICATDASIYMNLYTNPYLSIYVSIRANLCVDICASIRANISQKHFAAFNQPAHERLYARLTLCS